MVPILISYSEIEGAIPYHTSLRSHIGSTSTASSNSCSPVLQYLPYLTSYTVSLDHAPVAGHIILWASISNIVFVGGHAPNIT